ncbi:MAG TPA: hypothetical protein VE890_03390, partial [Thermoguttaceae bacterium]|nr:hypothetical protein [Thermoguttaceae bacterium]
VLAKSRLDTSGLKEGRVRLTGIDGKTLSLQHNAENDLPEVTRDDQSFDYAGHLDIYGPANENGPIAQEWLSGRLTVEAGGRRFTSTVTDDGQVHWGNR